MYKRQVVAEHALANADHHVLFEETKIPSSVSAYSLHLHMESVQIWKHAAITMNRRVESLGLHRIWHPMLLDL